MKNQVNAKQKILDIFLINYIEQSKPIDKILVEGGDCFSSQKDRCTLESI